MAKYTTEYREPGLLCLWIGIRPIVVVFKDEYVQVSYNGKQIIHFGKADIKWVINAILQNK